MYKYNTSNSRIYSRTLVNGDVLTETQHNPSGLCVAIESSRRGKGGTEMTIGFQGAENRNLKLSGRQARALFNSLKKHFDQID